MKKFFQNKRIAFTLAEMMVIFTLISVVAASTMPIITARQKVGTSASDVDDSISFGPWGYSESNGGYTYYDKPGVVAVGIEPTGDATLIGNPRLIVNNVNDSIFSSSQIAFTKTYGTVPYYTGRLAMDDKHNIAAGYEAYKADHLGENNIAIGTYTLNGSHEVGNDNIAMGYSALAGGGTYNRTIGLGYQAGLGSLASTSSVFIGIKAGADTYSDASGKANDVVAIGSYAGQRYKVSLYRSIFIGADTRVSGSYGSVSDGITIGYGAIPNKNENGTSNVYANGFVSIGYYAGLERSKSSPGYNIAIGTQAGKLKFTNPKNTISIGMYSGYGAITETHTSSSTMPIFIGTYAGGNMRMQQYDANDLYNPIVIGNYAGYNAAQNATSNSDAYEYASRSPIFIGDQAGANAKGYNLPGIAIGVRAGYSASSLQGTYSNIFIGYEAGKEANGLGNAICIGTGSCKFFGDNNQNVIQIGHGTGVTFKGAKSYLGRGVQPWTGGETGGWSNEQVYPVLMITTPKGEDGTILFYAYKVAAPATAFTVYSDKRLKENIKPYEHSLNSLRKINVYEYNMKDDDKSDRHIGVMAQDVQKVIPEAISKNEEGYLSLNTMWLFYAMVNAVKELDTISHELQNKFDNYVSEYKTALVRVDSLQKELRALEKENRALQRSVDRAYARAKVVERKMN